MAAAPHKSYLYGKHALTEALSHAPKTIRKVFLADTVDDPILLKLIRSAGVPVSALHAEKGVRDVAESASHQGVIAQFAPEELVHAYDSFVKMLDVSPHTSLVVLGEVQDPHNVGAIIRSAAAFGAAGVLFPEHNQAPITGAVVKVSAGMAFRVPLVRIGNVNETLRDLKKRGFWIYGLAGEGAQALTTEVFEAPTVFVVGNEADGMREKTREVCDILLSIPMHPRCESLNVAASAAVALYAWSAKHGAALQGRAAAQKEPKG